jgi:hypothetical protein
VAVQVDHHGAVPVATSDGEIVDSDDSEIHRMRVRKVTYQAQHATAGRRQAQPTGQARASPPRQRQANVLQCLSKRRRSAGMTGGQPVDLLSERDRWTLLLQAPPPSCPYHDLHHPPTDGQVNQRPPIPRVHSGRHRAARRTRRLDRRRPNHDPEPVGRVLDPVEYNVGQVRQKDIQSRARLDRSPQ